MAGISCAEVVNQMLNQSQVELYQQISVLQSQITPVLNKLFAYEATHTSMLNKSALSAATEWKASSYYQALEMASFEGTSKGIMVEGYNLLNKIGEQMRQAQDITYTLVVTDPKTSHQYIWKNVSHEFFTSQLIEIGGKGLLSLKSSSTIIGKMKKAEIESKIKELEQTTEYLDASKTKRKKMKSSIRKEVKSNFEQGISELFAWSDSKEYQEFDKRIRSLEGGKWSKVTSGHTIEAFLRLQQSGNMTELEAMLETMSAPIAFFKGGDIGMTQVKSDFADITNISTLITYLQKAHSLLSTILANIQNDSQSSSIISQADAVMNNNIKDAIQEFVSMFFK